MTKKRCVGCGKKLSVQPMVAKIEENTAPGQIFSLKVGAIELLYCKNEKCNRIGVLSVVSKEIES